LQLTLSSIGILIYLIRVNEQLTKTKAELSYFFRDGCWRGRQLLIC